MTRRATLVGAKRYAAAGGGYRRDAEVRKQGELRNAPSEQGDYVFEGQARQSLVRLTRRSLVQVQPPQPQRSRSKDLLFFSSRVMTRRATLVGAKRYAAAGGGYRRDAEVRKQGELRNAPSEQGDYVFEGQARQSLVRLTRRSLVQVQPPQPQRSRSSAAHFLFNLYILKTRQQKRCRVNCFLFRRSLCEYIPICREPMQ